MAALGLAAVAVGIASGCAPSRKPIGIELRSTGRFDGEIGRYASFDQHKSLAFAGEPDGVYVFGYAHEMADKDAAVAQALEECEARRKDRRIEGSCRTIAIDGEMLEGDSSTAF
jgi:hypothetical protein